MELVACVGADRESWGQVTGLINHQEWDKIVLIKSSQASDYPTPEGAYEIILETTKPLIELKAHLVSNLKNNLNDFEACLSIASGSGKEHMAIISALLSIPVGIRLVAFTKNGVEVVN
ncbi:MAG: hypothetical protein AABW79_04830 [Nanoarchaeota archaeon]